MPYLKYSTNYRAQVRAFAGQHHMVPHLAYNILGLKSYFGANPYNPYTYVIPKTSIAIPWLSLPSHDSTCEVCATPSFSDLSPDFKYPPNLETGIAVKNPLSKTLAKKSTVIPSSLKYGEKVTLKAGQRLILSATSDTEIIVDGEKVRFTRV